jgi:hypothetical protein
VLWISGGQPSRNFRVVKMVLVYFGFFLFPQQMCTANVEGGHQGLPSSFIAPSAPFK